MQKLHLVGFTTDLDGLIFSARKGSKAGSFMVQLDQQLLATIAEAERIRNGESGEGGEAGGRPRPARPASRLTPREIQARLRAGRSIPEVAAEAGVPLDWIDRFATPIAAEQGRMIDQARVMTFSKQRLGQSSQPLGISVRWNLLDKGVLLTEDEFEDGWSAFQVHEDIWMIRFRYTSRSRLQSAEWELETGGKSLTSRNRLASELGYVQKGRRPRAIAVPAPRPPAAPPVQVLEEVVESEPDEPPAPMIRVPARRRPKAAAKKRTTKKAPRAKKKARAKNTPKARVPRKPAAKKVRARKRAAKKVRARKPAAKKVRARKPAAKKTAPKKAAPKRAAPKRAAAMTTPAKTTVKRAKKVASAPKKATVRKATPPRKTAPAAAQEAGPGPAPPARRAKRSGRGAVKRPAARPARRRAPNVAAKRADRTQRQAAPRSRPAPTRPRAQRRTAPANGGARRQATSAALSGPLARSLLARRLLARKAQGDGDERDRPLRLT